MIRRIQLFISHIVVKVSTFIGWGEVVGWVKFQRLKLNLFILRCLKWWFYFIANCIIAITATSFGFALGVALTVLLYDDGLERVIDLYNYFKSPPRRQGQGFGDNVSVCQTPSFKGEDRNFSGFESHVSQYEQCHDTFRRKFLLK